MHNLVTRPTQHCTTTSWCLQSLCHSQQYSNLLLKTRKGPVSKERNYILDMCIGVERQIANKLV